MTDVVPDRVASRLRENCTRNGHVPYYAVDPVTGCWVWLRERDRDGYGRLTWYVDGRNVRGIAHRVMFVLFVGPIARGLVLDHIACDNPPCVNPSHVRQSTNRDNIARSPRFPGRRVICPAGHPYDDANTSRRLNGARRCRTCDRMSARDRMQRLRAARGAA